MSWYLDVSSKLTHSALPDEITGNVIQTPYPATYWDYGADGKLFLGYGFMIFPIVDSTTGRDDNAVMSPPYPASLWYIDNNKLTNDLQIEPIPFGAFACAEFLVGVILPESLESIGPESFTGTALLSVTIPNNQCTYYATSFPPGCVVTGGRLIE